MKICTVLARRITEGVLLCLAASAGAQPVYDAVRDFAALGTIASA